MNVKDPGLKWIRGAADGGKEKGGAPFDAPPCRFLPSRYFGISEGGAAGAGAGVPAPTAWFAAYSVSWRNVGLL